MKNGFMLLVLLLFANPVLANTGKSPSECFNIYRDYLNDQNTSSSQIMQFMDNCMPARPVRNDEPLHRKLLQIKHGNDKIETVKA